MLLFIDFWKFCYRIRNFATEFFKWKNITLWHYQLPKLFTDVEKRHVVIVVLMECSNRCTIYHCTAAAALFAIKRMLANLLSDWMRELMYIVLSFMIVCIMKVTEETLMMMIICWECICISNMEWKKETVLMRPTSLLLWRTADQGTSI